ncbi:MAG TPA: ABC transporter permease [Terriglobales bacterium]|nr:ABC transporter permease [Terriglobales bacterium]
MTSILRDLRYALRALAHAPAFALIAVLTLGLGVGANTAIFSVVDAVLLRPLPFPHPGQLLSLRENDRQFPAMSVCYPDYLDWLRDNRSFQQLSVYRGTGAVLTHAGPPAVINGQDASWQYFPVLGIQPELGRTFLPSEDKLGAANVVVLADRLWRQRFAASPAILGQTVELNAKPYTVIGVMPRGFPGLAAGANAPQFWVPLGAEATQASGLMERGDHPGLNGLGRLKPGVTLAMARADLGRIARALAQQYPKTNTGEGVTVRSYLDQIVGNSSRAALWVLLAAVGMVLLIACANVANLLLARAATRQKANAIRSALGASRARLLREHLSESLCLGVAGSGVGLGLAWAATRAVPALIPPGVTRAAQAGLDLRVLAFTIGLALATTVLFGLVPAWHASQIRIADALKVGGRESAAGGGRLRGALVAIEMALALVLLVGAGLLIRSLLALQHVDPGFDPHHVLSFEIGLPEAKYPQPAQSLAFFRQARRNLARLPGVVAVGTGNPLPFSGNDWENSFTIVGRPAPPPGQTPSSNYAMISGDYFHAMGMQLLSGRAFDDGDQAATTPVAIIDATFARRYWPQTANHPDPYANALGQQIHSGKRNLTVVGVVARVMDYGLDQATEMDKLPEMFVPLAQTGFNQTDSYVVVRTGGGDPLQMRAAATAAIQALDPDQPLYDVLSMDQRVALSLAQRRLTLWLMGAFALLALALAAIGIYGVLSYAVAQRRQEIGVRMALGADRGRVLGLVLGQGLKLAAAGAAAGLVAALLLGRLASSFLFGVTITDPLTLAGVPALLLGIAALACYLPARRATRVDPVIALRGE